MNASVAVSSAQGFLNDPLGNVFTFSLLVPHMQNAHRDLQLALYVNGLPIIRNVSQIIPVPATAGPFSLGADLGLLPFDLIQPIADWAIKERYAGTSVENFVDMTSVDFLPAEDPGVELVYYSWSGGDLNFIGCTTAREIYIRYLAGLPLPYADSDPLGFTFAETFLGPMTAAYQVKSLGNQAQFEDLKRIADINLDTIIRANVRGDQRPSRRRGYQRRGRIAGHV